MSRFAQCIKRLDMQTEYGIPVVLEFWDNGAIAFNSSQEKIALMIEELEEICSQYRKLIEEKG